MTVSENGCICMGEKLCLQITSLHILRHKGLSERYFISRIYDIEILNIDASPVAMSKLLGDLCNTTNSHKRLVSSANGECASGLNDTGAGETCDVRSQVQSALVIGQRSREVGGGVDVGDAIYKYLVLAFGP